MDILWRPSRYNLWLNYIGLILEEHMGKIIIVAGVPGAGKSTLLYEAWKRVEKAMKYNILSFGTEMLNLCHEAGLVSNRDDMRNLNPDIQEEMQWRVTKRISERPENILLDTHCAIKTGSGSYLPGLTPRMLERMSPSAIILVDAHEAEIRGRRKLDKSRPLRTIEANDDILEHKVINRAYAAAFSARSGCLLRIIQNNTGEFERAVQEFIDTLRFIGVEQFIPSVNAGGKVKETAEGVAGSPPDACKAHAGAPIESADR